jgi:hypothetical protein
LDPCCRPIFQRTKLVEIAAGIEPVQDGRIYIDNYPMLFKLKASAPSTRPGLTSPSSAAGLSCTSPAPMSGS